MPCLLAAAAPTCRGPSGPVVSAAVGGQGFDPKATVFVSVSSSNQAATVSFVKSGPEDSFPAVACQVVDRVFGLEASGPIGL